MTDEYRREDLGSASALTRQRDTRLSLSRKCDESILCDGPVTEITVMKIKSKSVVLKITAPRGTRISRSEPITRESVDARDTD